MSKIIRLPHEAHESTCYINGLFDVLSGHKAEYDYFLLPIIGGMAGFAYLKFKAASPPCMVYWGNSPGYLLRDLSKIIGFTQYISEGRSFKNEFPKMKACIDKGQPVMAGALDMYYLHYYVDLYQQQHVPIHYVLVVGYDDNSAEVFIHDCGFNDIQKVPYDEFEKALDIHVPGLSKKNTYRVFTLPEILLNEEQIAERGLMQKASRMLTPPVSMFGIPAMRKLAKEIAQWTEKHCYDHMIAYAGLTPPLISSDLSKNDGLRFEQAGVLKKMGAKYNRDNWNKAADLFIESGKLIIEMCRHALKYNGPSCSPLLDKIADLEEKAYHTILSENK